MLESRLMYLILLLNEALLRLFGRDYSFCIFPIFLLDALLLPDLVKKLLETLILGLPDHTLGPLLIELRARFQHNVHIIQINLAWFAQ